MPPLPVELHPEAVREAAEAREWYAQRSPTAALRFLHELDHGIDEVPSIRPAGRNMCTEPAGTGCAGFRSCSSTACATIA